MDYKIKLAAALPKGDLNGWSDRTLAEEISERRIRRAAEQPLIAIVVYEVKETSTGKNGVITTSLELARVQPVQTEDGMRAAEGLLAAEFSDQRACMPPYEVQALSSRAFVGLPRTTSEIDQREAAEQDLMSPTDELRRHLERVHGRANAGELTALEAEQAHESDHAGDLPGELDHDQAWLGWTRVDLEAAAAEAEDGGDYNPDGTYDPDAADGVLHSHGPTKPPYGSPERDAYDRNGGGPASAEDPDSTDPDRAQDYNPDDAPTADNVLPLFSSDRA